MRTAVLVARAVVRQAFQQVAATITTYCRRYKRNWLGRHIQRGCHDDSEPELEEQTVIDDRFMPPTTAPVARV